MMTKVGFFKNDDERSSSVCLPDCCISKWLKMTMEVENYNYKMIKFSALNDLTPRTCKTDVA